MDWLQLAINNRSITPEQLDMILKNRREREREFREQMRVFETPPVSLFSEHDLFYINKTIDNLKS